MTSRLRVMYLVGCVLIGMTQVRLAAQTSFGSVNVGSKVTSSVTVSIPAAATLGGIGVTTQGNTSLDYTNAGGGSCTVGTAYAAGATCTVKVAFKPTLAGQRNGAAVLTDNAGNVVGTALVEGTGVGPQVAFLPGTETQVGSFSYPGNLAVDGSGHVYVAAGSDVFKLTPPR